MLLTPKLYAHVSFLNSKLIYPTVHSMFSSECLMCISRSKMSKTELLALLSIISLWLCWVFPSWDFLQLWRTGHLSSCGAWEALWWLFLLQTWALGCTGFSSCSTWPQQLWLLDSRARFNNWGIGPQLLRSMWDLLGSGVKPVSPELAIVFFTTEPPEKPVKVGLFV